MSPILNFEDEFQLTIKLKKKDEYKQKSFDVGLAFINQDNVTVAGPNSSSLSLKAGAEVITYSLKKLPFQPGDYSVTIAVIDRDTNEPFDFYDRAISFHVISDKPAQGVVAIDGDWDAK